MAKGNEIIVSGNPKGVFEDAVMGDTSKPGQIMMIQAGSLPVLGRFTWVAAVPPTDGVPVILGVLDMDSMWGKTANDAYPIGVHARIYFPIQGEELNVLAGIPGTANFSVGDRLKLNPAGQFTQASTGSVSIPFVSLESVTGVVTPYLLWAKCVSE